MRLPRESRPFIACFLLVIGMLFSCAVINGGSTFDFSDMRGVINRVMMAVNNLVNRTKDRVMQKIMSDSDTKDILAEMKKEIMQTLSSGTAGQAEGDAMIKAAARQAGRELPKGFDIQKYSALSNNELKAIFDTLPAGDKQLVMENKDQIKAVLGR